MRLGLLAAGLILAACGGKVIVDGPKSSDGQGGHAAGTAAGPSGGSGGSGGTSGNGSNGAASPSGVGVSTNSGAGGAPTACTSMTCVADSDGSCSCNGPCEDGSTAEVQCSASPLDCACFKNGQPVGHCTPSDAPPSCELHTTCCAALF